MWSRSPVGTGTTCRKANRRTGRAASVVSSDLATQLFYVCHSAPERSGNPVFHCNLLDTPSKIEGETTESAGFRIVLLPTPGQGSQVDLFEYLAGMSVLFSITYWKRTYRTHIQVRI